MWSFIGSCIYCGTGLQFRKLAFGLIQTEKTWWRDSEMFNSSLNEFRKIFFRVKDWPEHSEKCEFFADA